MTPGKVICSASWQKWRHAAGVTGNKASRDQWIKLCAAFALSKRGKPVNLLTIKVFIRENGDDPLAFMPGLTPLGAADTLPSVCYGRDLPDLISQYLGIDRTEDAIRLWCISAGLSFGRGLQYSSQDIKKIISEYAKCARNRRNTAKQNLKRTGAFAA